MNFSIPPRKLIYCGFLVSFEILHLKIVNLSIYADSGHTNDSIKTKLKDVTLSGYRSYSLSTSAFADEELEALKSLQEDNSIVILKPDIGNGIVILDKDDYRKKIDEILNDSTKLKTRC